MDDAERTVHVLLGCNECSKGKDRWDPHTFCLGCGTVYDGREGGECLYRCDGELYSHG